MDEREKLNTFLLAHSAREKVTNELGKMDITKFGDVSFEEFGALVEISEMAIGEIVPTKAEIELYLSENEKLLTLSPDDTRFYEAIENVKTFQRDYGL